MRKLIFIFLIFGTLFACSDKKKEDASSLPEPGQAFKKGMSITATKQGYKEWKVIADALTQKESDIHNLYAKNLKIFLFDKTGKISNVIYAKKGILNITTNDLVLKNNVILENKEKNSTIYTEELRYNSKKNLIFSDKHVKIVDKSGIVEGDGIEVDLKLNKIVLKHSHGKK